MVDIEVLWFSMGTRDHRALVKLLHEAAEELVTLLDSRHAGATYSSKQGRRALVACFNVDQHALLLEGNST